jgi:hypothetical protein
MSRHQSDIEPAFLQRCSNIPFVHLVERHHYVRIIFMPSGQQTRKRLPNWRHPNTEPYLPYFAGPIAISGSAKGIEIGKHSVDMHQYGFAAACQAYSKMAPFEKRHAEFVFKTRNPSARD